MADTETETEMEDMVVDDRARTIHAKEDTRAMGTMKILASFEGIRGSETLCGLSCGGSLESSVFSPFITWGKRFLDALSSKVNPPPSHSFAQFWTYIPAITSLTGTKHMVTRPSPTDHLTYLLLWDSLVSESLPLLCFPLLFPRLRRGWICS